MGFDQTISLLIGITNRCIPVVFHCCDKDMEELLGEQSCLLSNHTKAWVSLYLVGSPLFPFGETIQGSRRT
jgi:hypothetical protein